MKNRLKVVLDEYIDEIEAEAGHTIIGRFTDDTGTVTSSITLLSNSNFNNYLEEIFYNRYFPIIYNEETETVAESVARNFAKKWESYVEENQHNFDRIAQALYTDYNPLYNYNKMQHTVNVKTGSEIDGGTDTFGNTQDTLTKTGSESERTDFGQTQDTLTKSGKDTVTNTYGQTQDTLTKSGKETLSKNFGDTEKNTTESGAIVDQHSIGAKQTTSEVATMDTNTYQPTGRVSEAARTDTDTHNYNNHNVKETEEARTESEERTFANYQETSTGAARTDTEERTFANYQETSTGASRTDTLTRNFNNYQETRTGASKTDSHNNTHTYNSVTDDFTDETKGNIGVMESVTMIESELRLRAVQIGLDLLRKFFDMYSYSL